MAKESNLLVNRHRLRLYQKPMSKDQFVSNILTKDEFDIMNVEGCSSIVATLISFLEEK
jgi:hypothetical protein